MGSLARINELSGRSFLNEVKEHLAETDLINPDKPKYYYEGKKRIILQVMYSVYIEIERVASDSIINSIIDAIVDLEKFPRPETCRYHSDMRCFYIPLADNWKVLYTLTEDSELVVVCVFGVICGGTFPMH